MLYVGESAFSSFHFLLGWIQAIHYAAKDVTYHFLTICLSSSLNVRVCFRTFSKTSGNVVRGRAKPHTFGLELRACFCAIAVVCCVRHSTSLQPSRCPQYAVDRGTADACVAFSYFK
ncbi:unnamed protein product [Scytosiphon promiscuus]